MSFGYIPDFKHSSALKDLFFILFGFPYSPRRNEARKVFKMLSLEKKDKILDVGCGDGIWYNQLKKGGFNVKGIDISSHDLNTLKERAKRMNLIPDVEKADAQRMPFESEVFDKVYSICTLEHIDSDAKTCLEIHRVLRRDGIAVISTTIDKIPFFTKLAFWTPHIVRKIIFNELVTKSINHTEYFDKYNIKYKHVRNYNENELIRLLKTRGFKIEKVDYNCKFFGSLVYSAFHTLKLLYRNKTPGTDYSFNNPILFALFGIITYPLFFIDGIIPIKGLMIILKLRKL